MKHRAPGGTGGSAAGSDHVERHDDQVRLFATRLSEGHHEFSYVVRATTSGTFRTAPAHVEEITSRKCSGGRRPRTHRGHTLTLHEVVRTFRSGPSEVTADAGVLPLNELASGKSFAVFVALWLQPRPVALPDRSTIRRRRRRPFSIVRALSSTKHVRKPARRGRVSSA